MGYMLTRVLVNVGEKISMYVYVFMGRNVGDEGWQLEIVRQVI